MEGRVYYTRLLEKYIDGTSSAEETAELMEELARNADTEEWQTLLTRITENAAADLNYEPERWEEMIGNIVRTKEEAPVVEIRRRRSWIPYAAAAVVLIGIGAYLWNIQKDELHETTASSEARSAKEDVAPGGNKAVLTLADGSHIILDSAANGKIAQQGAAQVERDANGNVLYSATVGERVMIYNTLTVPRGSEVVNVTLSDGSKVWLNADSRLRYPVAFVGNERRVEVEGEAYFEIAKDRKKPFRVQCHPDSPDGGEGSIFAPIEIEVLGTEFNINAYPDEAGIKTSLVEGSVKIKTSAPSRAFAPLREITLKPGEAYQNGKTFKADIEQDIAWKNGRFLFNGATIETILRQAARWYNVKIVYEGKLPQTNYIGDISRQKNISELLNILEQTGTVQFNIEGNTVTVRP